MMSNSTIKDILKNIPDSNQRRMVSDIMFGKVVKRIRCMSKKCNGRVVANIYQDGKIVPTTEKGRMYLRAYRHRLDGFMGFQCWCGNDSRLCSAEKGVSGIEHNAVQKSDIEQVWQNLQKKSPNYIIANGKQEIDNFLIEDL